MNIRKNRNIRQVTVKSTHMNTSSRLAHFREPRFELSSDELSAIASVIVCGVEYSQSLCDVQECRTYRGLLTNC